MMASPPKALKSMMSLKEKSRSTRRSKMEGTGKDKEKDKDKDNRKDIDNSGGRSRSSNRRRSKSRSKSTSKVNSSNKLKTRSKSKVRSKSNKIKKSASGSVPEISGKPSKQSTKTGASSASKQITLGGLEINVEIKRGRGLVPMDRSLTKFGRKVTSDPFVKVYGGKEYLGKTSVQEATLDPVFNEQFHLVLGADDANFILTKNGAVKMEFRIFDYDTHKEHDPMGVVKVPLKCLEPPSTKWYKVTEGKGKYFNKDATGELEISLAVSARKMLSLVRGNNHTLEFNDIHVGLGWDVEDGAHIDLDSSCVALDNRGNILMDETVYYGNLTNPNLSVMHSGDDRDGRGEEMGGDDEVIICHLDKLPTKVKVLYFLLTVATPNATFANVKSAKVRVIEAQRKLGIATFEPNQFGETTAMFLMRIAKNFQNQWILSIIEDTDLQARDFGSLIPELKGYTRDLYGDIQIDPSERIAVMRKGSSIRVSDYVRNAKIPKWVTFGLSWDVTDGVNIDLDASAICLGKDLRPLDIVFFKQLRSKDGSVRHSGDEREGDEIGDDESINVSLPNTSPDIYYVAFVINSYSGQELDDVAKASCHLYNTRTGVDIAKYALSKAQSLDGHTALIMGCLYRGDEEQWDLRIISLPCNGKTAHDNVEELQRYLHFNPPSSPLAPPDTDNILNIMPSEVPKYDSQTIVPATVFKQGQFGS